MLIAFSAFAIDANGENYSISMYTLGMQSGYANGSEIEATGMTNLYQTGFTDSVSENYSADIGIFSSSELPQYSIEANGSLYSVRMFTLALQSGIGNGSEIEARGMLNLYQMGFKNARFSANLSTDIGIFPYPYESANEPPVVELISPPDGLTSYNDSFNFTFNVTDDNSPILTCTFFFGNSTNVSINATNGEITNITLTDLEGGDYDWYVTCLDGDGEVGISDTWSLALGLTSLFTGTMFMSLGMMMVFLFLYSKTPHGFWKYTWLFGLMGMVVHSLGVGQWLFDNALAESGLEKQSFSVLIMMMWIMVLIFGFILFIFIKGAFEKGKDMVLKDDKGNEKHEGF